MDISSENSNPKTKFPPSFDYFCFVHHYTRCHTWSAKMNHGSSRSQKKVPTAIRPSKLYRVCVCTPNPFLLHLFFGRMRFFFLSPNRLIVYCINRNGQEHMATNAYLSLVADQQVHANIFSSHYLWNIPYTYI